MTEPDEYRGVEFRKSTASGAGDCVEVGLDRRDGAVLVRRSDGTGGPPQRFTRSEWEAFIVGVGRREFDYDELPG